jgi:hypothetical protein
MILNKFTPIMQQEKNEKFIQREKKTCELKHLILAEFQKVIGSFLVTF